MADLSGYRDHGSGGERRRHSRHSKRTRGGEEDGGAEEGVKRSKREYDDGYGEERGGSRRSMSPRDGTRRDVRRDNRDEHRHSRDDYRSQQRLVESSHREARHSNPIAERSRSMSSTRHHHSHHHRHHHRHRQPSMPSSRTQDELPFGARPLVRSDLDAFRPLFAQYLEVQKNKEIATMDEREVRGRWKSFVGKWNHGDLAEGWYRPETLDEARQSGIGTSMSAHTEEQDTSRETASPLPLIEQEHSGEINSKPSGSEQDDDDDDDEYGPTLPPGSEPPRSSTSTKHGPGIPSRQDLDLRREDAEEDRQQRVSDLRQARRADRALQKARLEELVPRAEPGTRERQLEKRREAGDKMRAFRERSPGLEVGEAELMGGGDGVGELKRLKAVAERRKSEREIRREEEDRARVAEREERIREYRVREEGTMEVLRRIARERFG
ncbi:hypothetical protein F4804DRAFT_305538 [Jackrogersella minutella]|nr:hypothetical protein F4804DRAFT_305538 [Jackrogersella minutella]